MTSAFLLPRQHLIRIKHLKYSIKVYIQYFTSQSMVLLRNHRNYVHKKTLCKVMNFLMSFRSANLHIPASCMDTLWVYQARRSCSPSPLPSWSIAHSKNYCLFYKQASEIKTNLTNTHLIRLPRTLSFPFTALMLKQNMRNSSPVSNTFLQSCFSSNAPLCQKWTYVTANKSI